MIRLRRLATEIWNAGVESVRPRPLVSHQVEITSNRITIAGYSFSRNDYDRLIVIGAGKAGADMAAGLMDVVKPASPHLPTVGWINIPGRSERAIDDVTLHPARPPGVNEPTIEAMEGTKKIIEFVAGATARDICVALISGGGSALLPMPIDGISLEDKLAVTRFLSGAGANIEQLNTVRKHLSGVKGGGLLRICKSAPLVTLVLSDVLGDPLDLIASGPTVVDTSTAKDALDVLSEFDPNGSLPDSIYRTLRTAKPKVQPPNSNSLAPIIVGNNRRAVEFAEVAATPHSEEVICESAHESEGSAESIGRKIADLLADASITKRSRCIISGGEPTVKLAEPSKRGRGGRNQQLVLAAYERLREHNLSDQQWQSIVLLSGGTDGEDGPTDAAGAVIDFEVHRRAKELNLDIADALSRNDAYSFFEACGGLLISGPTGTNVCDLRVALCKPAS